MARLWQGGKTASLPLPPPGFQWDIRDLTLTLLLPLPLPLPLTLTLTPALTLNPNPSPNQATRYEGPEPEAMLRLLNQTG